MNVKLITVSINFQSIKIIRRLRSLYFIPQY